MAYLDLDGLDKVMKLLIGYSGSKNAELKESFDTKFNNMVNTVNSVTRSVTLLQSNMENNINDIHQSITSMIESINTSLSEITTSIDNLSTSMTEKIDLLSQDFDNIDTQVNSIKSDLQTLNDRVDTISGSIDGETGGLISSVESIKTDVGDIKTAMNDMIVNIEVDQETGQFIVHKYDGRVINNTVVEAIDDSDIDSILDGSYVEETEEDTSVPTESTP